MVATRICFALTGIRGNTELKTRITEMLGIKYPIIAGPMAYISDAEFVAAVSNAGGLGIMMATTMALSEITEEVKKAKSLTDKPFAVNITLLPSVKPVDYGAYMQAAIDGGATIIETSGRSPEPYIDLMKDAGVIKMHRATRTKDLVKMEEIGVDIVTIVGTEAAGHPGQEEVTTMVRVPIMADAVKIPVVAAGGISDGRGLVAALALGAEGILMGTRFMCSKEARIHGNIKKYMQNMQEMDTILTELSLKNALRVARTSHTEKIVEMEQQGATLEDLLPLISGQLGKEAYKKGMTDTGQISVGQIVGLIKDEPSIQEIMDGMMADAKAIMGRFNGMGLTA